MKAWIKAGWFILALGLSPVVLYAAEEAEAADEFVLPAGVKLEVPEGQEDALSWALPPLKRDTPQGLAGFDVDGAGQVWLVLAGPIKTLACPERKLLFGVGVDLTGFIILEDGTLIGSSPRGLGSITTDCRMFKKTKKTFPLACFEPRVKLRHVKTAIYPASDGGFFLSGQDPQTKKWEIYAYTLEAEDNLKLVARLPERPGAVAGSAKAVYFSQGPLILSVDLAKGVTRPVAAEPEGRAITALAWGSSALFYSAGRTTGVVCRRQCRPFLRGAETRLRQREGALYLQLGGYAGVLKITDSLTFAAAFAVELDGKQDVKKGSEETEEE
jgi:hypothetical protein